MGYVLSAHFKGFNMYKGGCLFLLLVVTAKLTTTLESQNLVMNPNFDPGECEVIAYEDSVPIQVEYPYPYWLTNEGRTKKREYLMGLLMKQVDMYGRIHAVCLMRQFTTLL